VICPQCTKEVPLTETQYLSMYTCPKCQAVYFIDITGQPEFGDMSLPIPDEPQVEGESIHGESVEIHSLESVNFQAAESHLENQFQTNELNEVSAHGSLETMSADDLGSDQNPFEAPAQIENISDFNSAALEITDFANQDNTISALSYDLKVTGLDTKETMLHFREAVDDSKFGWITQELFSTIKNGQCEFKNLNPIQAFVLAQRIQFLDIEMEWKQNVQN
jgi:hypothetical protein